MPLSKSSSKVKRKSEDFTNYHHPVTFAQAAPELRSISKSSTLLSPGMVGTLVLQNPESTLSKFVKLSTLCINRWDAGYLARYLP
jgi:hypothetical protein